jgi:hypothetical protein
MSELIEVRWVQNSRHFGGDLRKATIGNPTCDISAATWDQCAVKMMAEFNSKGIPG